MRAYWYDDKPGDQRLPHDSGTPVPQSYLSTLGLIYEHCPTISAVDTLATERAYKNRDETTVSPAKMGAVYEEKVRSFFEEHLHEMEEIRYVLDGRGYFDVRNEGDDRWVRVALEREDLLVLPAGIWHRFTTDGGNYIHAMRLFKEEPKWTPLNREPALEENPYRKEYVQQRAQAVKAA